MSPGDWLNSGKSGQIHIEKGVETEVHSCLAMLWDFFFRYSNGDTYEGAFKDGQRHGHGIYRQGQHASIAASVYIGEWVSDKKQGYGIMDDVMKGKIE